jgi:hypothetical protein
MSDTVYNLATMPRNRYALRWPDNQFVVSRDTSGNLIGKTPDARSAGSFSKDQIDAPSVSEMIRSGRLEAIPFDQLGKCGVTLSEVWHRRPTAAEVRAGRMS